MDNRWRDDEAGLGELEQLAYASRLLAADPDLVLHGGGNTSLKRAVTDALGRPVNLMYIKPSGVDMARITAEGFTALRLDDLQPWADRDVLDDDVAVQCVLAAMADPRAAMPSIETLLHAFLPDRFVLHSHSDALLALCNRTDGAQRVLDALCDDVVSVGYRRPGAQLAHDVASARRGNPEVLGIVLLKHGLVTFGSSAREAYERHVSLVTRCETDAPTPICGAPGADRPRAVLLAPQLRGALGPGLVLVFDDDDETRAFVADEALLAASQRGPATADHILRTRRIPCIVGEIADIERFRAADREHALAGDRDGLDPADPSPRVLLVPGVGMWTAGNTVEEARVARDIYRHTMRMIRCAGDAWEPIGAADQRHAEYWPLQVRKRALPSGELAGRVAWISGAASGIGRAIARLFAQEGAHVVVTDLDAAGARAVADEIGDRALGFACDVTQEAQVEDAFDATLLAFGGVDIVVSNAGVAKPAPVEELTLDDWEASMRVNATGHFLVARAALRILRTQGLGGSIVFNASKNVMAPGKGFGAYSAAKAAETQLAKVLALEGAEMGVRVNSLHPDAVFKDTLLWSDEVRRERAEAHGVDVLKLEEFYAARNLLKVAVRPEDVAEAALFFASDRSSRTTGACLPVDGGVKEAFPR